MHAFEHAESSPTNLTNTSSDRWNTVMPRFWHTETASIAHTIPPEGGPPEFEEPSTAPGTVAIWGLNDTTLALAQDMGIHRQCRRVALWDPQNAPRQAVKALRQACAIYGSHTRVVGSDQQHILQDADVVVLSPDQTLAPEARYRALTQAASALGAYAPDARVVLDQAVTGEPWCHWVQHASGLPPERIIGLDGLLETAQLQLHLAELFDLPPEQVHTWVFGGHGLDTATLTRIPILSQTTLNGIAFEQALSSDPACPLSRQRAHVMTQLHTRLRNDDMRTETGGALPREAGLSRLIEALLSDHPIILPCTAYVQGYNLPAGRYVTTPARLGSHGIIDGVELPLTDEEHAQFRQAVQSLEQHAIRVQPTSSTRSG